MFKAEIAKKFGCVNRVSSLSMRLSVHLILQLREKLMMEKAAATGERKSPKRARVQRSVSGNPCPCAMHE